MGANHSSPPQRTIPYYKNTARIPPTRPFHKHGHQRSCFLRAAGILAISHRHRSHDVNSASSILMELVLLQDWQRVLIRATLFPKEITKSCVVKFYGRRWNVLPLHLACALQPPSQVIAILSAGRAADVPVTQKSLIRGHRLRVGSSIRRGGGGASSPWLSSPQSHLTKSGDDAPRNFYSQNPVLFLENHSTRSSMAESSIQNRREQKKSQRKHLFRYKTQTYHHQSQRSLISFEESIGDMSTTFSMNEDDHSEDEDDNTTIYDDYSIGKYLEQRGMVLQLTTSGDIIPLNMTQDTLSTTEGEESSFEFPCDILLQAVAETQTLLPIHIACIYRASPQVLQELIQCYPKGTSSAVMGMLPIHLIAAGWLAEPLLPPVTSIFPTLEEVCSPADRCWTLDCLKILIQAAPDCVAARSCWNRSLLPCEWLVHNSNVVLRDACIRLLDQESHHDILSRDRCKPVDPPGKCASSVPDDASQHPSDSVELSSKTPNTIPPLSSMLLKRNWDNALTLMERDPLCAREWYYGLDESAVLWKRLPLHVACVVSAPLRVIESLIRAFPQALEIADPHSGSIPLHLACWHNSPVTMLRALLQACPGTTKVADIHGRLPIHCAVLVQASYATIESLIQHDPASVLMPNFEGKTPLQLAHHSYPSASPVLGLLELVWM